MFHFTFINICMCVFELVVPKTTTTRCGGGGGGLRRRRESDPYARIALKEICVNVQEGQIGSTNGLAPFKNGGA